MLQPDQLAAIADTARAGLDVRRVLAGRDDVPRLTSIAVRCAPSLEGLASRLEAAVEPDGSRLRDSASPRLRGLRREISQARGRATDKLRQLATQLKAHLQEDFVTERGGRPVLAVRATSRSAVPGIVHDTSGSGQTLFVEPFAIVEAQNAIRELAAAEREEVDRILAELSALVRVAAPDVIECVDVLAHIDLALASGALARRLGGCPVEISDDVWLVEARHPLLDRAIAVPIDLDLRGIRGVVVSGPNTGGKTVGMKTLGLAALMHQCGLQTAGGARQPAGVRRGAGRHRRRAVDRDEPLDVLGPHPQPHADPRRGPASARWCCSTRSPRAPIRSRARRSRGRCSSASSSGARS